MRSALLVPFLFIGLQCPAFAEQGSDSLLSGLWRYQKISHGGEMALDNTGLFLFYQGRFYQQTIDDDMGQAHAGSYSVVDDKVSFDVEMGILVSEKNDPVMSVRLNGGNQASISYRDPVLTLGFEESTVQTLVKKEDVEVADVHTVKGGYLVFTEDCFIYMSLQGDTLEAGSGTYTKTEDGFSLQANPWISVAGKRVTYSHNETIGLSLEKSVFRFSNGRELGLTMISGQQN